MAEPGPPERPEVEPEPEPAAPGRRWPSAVVFTLTLGAAAVLLGIWGVSRLPDELSATDTLYRTLQLFYVGAEIPPEGTPWQLDAARFLAPAVVIYAVVATIVALTRERIRRWYLWRLGSDHVLIVGLGSRGVQLARTLRAGERAGLDPVGLIDPTGRGRRPGGLRRRMQGMVTGHVVGLELDESSGATASLRRTGLTVITGDGRDPEILRQCSAEDAAEIALLAGGDTVNLETLAALRGVIDADGATSVHVAIDDPAVWAALHRVPLGEDAGSRQVHFISVPDRTAQLLIDASLAGAGGDRPRGKLVIWGQGPAVARLAAHALRVPLVEPGGELVLAGTDSEENLLRIEQLDPWAFEQAQLTASADPDDWVGAELAFVCGLGEAEALAAASTLAARLDERPLLYVSVPDSDAREALLAAGVALPRTELIPVSETLFGERWLADEVLEDLARARHELYRRARIEREGEGGAGEPSMRPWERLPEELRLSNRAFAAGVTDVLGRVGAELVPLTGSEIGELPLSEEVIEELAVAEHDRWAADKRSRGWEHGPEIDHDAKRHPCLVGWEELSEAEREKDFDSIRGLPEMLAAAGYEVVVPSVEGSPGNPN